jgi:hypothetical protein
MKILVYRQANVILRDGKIISSDPVVSRTKGKNWVIRSPEKSVIGHHGITNSMKIPYRIVPSKSSVNNQKHNIGEVVVEKSSIMEVTIPVEIRHIFVYNHGRVQIDDSSMISQNCHFHLCSHGKVILSPSLHVRSLNIVAYDYGIMDGQKSKIDNAIIHTWKSGKVSNLYVCHNGNFKSSNRGQISVSVNENAKITSSILDSGKIRIN